MPLFIQFFYTHTETIIGVSVALILTIIIFFLFRNVAEEGSSGSSQLDVQALENTLKRVLKQTPVTTVGASAGAAGLGGIVDEEDKTGGNLDLAIAEREKKIADLTVALEAAKSQAGTTDPKDAMATLELQNKMRELEARLAEYAIIEDDIADLSLYKDENQRLKAELDQLRVAGAAAPTSPKTIITGDAPAAAPVTKITADDDDVMKEFAAAVNDQVPPKAEASKAIEPPIAQAGSSVIEDSPPDAIAALSQITNPQANAPAAQLPSQADIDALLNSASAGGEEEDPLAGTLDTSKMMEEVASLGAAEDSQDDALDGALDTDKLLSEVNALSPGGESSDSGADLPPGDDLFGEFKDEEKER